MTKSPEIFTFRELSRLFAIQSGLREAIEKYPDDIYGSAEDAKKHVNELVSPHDPTVEAWPPMKIIFP